MTPVSAISGVPIPSQPDLARMRGERYARLQAQLEAQGLDGLVLLGTSPVTYATGALTPGADSSRASLLRPVAVVVKGQAAPHLFTPYPEGAPSDLSPDHLHGPLFPDLADGGPVAAAAVKALLPAGARIAIDEQPHPFLAALDGLRCVSAAAVLGAAKLCKTPDELACIRTAQQINERAMVPVHAMLRAGVRQVDLTAVFLREIFELGATSNGIDPIWQVMPATRAAGPWTVHGDIAFPTPTTDRILRDGDVIWVDTGIGYEGYASDFGRTWIVGPPTARQRSQYERWKTVCDAVLAILKPGASGLDLVRAAIAANDGTKPWIEHFYLAHGIGTDSAEMPLIGTDLGTGFDERTIMAPGMVVVLEPVIWDDGAAGYRSEDVYAVTDDGWVSLSDHPYDPFP